MTTHRGYSLVRFWRLPLVGYLVLAISHTGAQNAPLVRPPAFYGVDDDPVWNYRPEELGEFGRLLRESGAKALRMPIRWNVVEPRQGEWRFAIVERALGEVPPEVEILATLMSIPSWANGAEPKKGEGYADSYPPKNLEAWSAYVFETVSHFKGRIRHWEIWNEENGVDFYRPLPDAAGFAALQKAAYTAAKRADPDCVVLLGGLQMNGIIASPWSKVKTPDFLEALYQAGAGSYFDGCNIHPYVLPKEGASYMMSLLRETLQVMARHGDAAKPLWITEVGCGATTATAEQEQAGLLRETYRLAAQEPRVARLFWFLLRDTAQNQLGPEGTMGLFKRNGTGKPAAAEFQRLTKEAKPSGPAVPAP